MAERCIAPYDIRAGDLAAYIDGAASPRLAKHIATCPACAAEVAALRHMDRLFRRAFDPANRPVVTGHSPHRVGPLNGSAKLHPGTARPGPEAGFQPDAGRLNGIKAAGVRRLVLASISAVMVLSLVGVTYFVVRSNRFQLSAHPAGAEPAAEAGQAGAAVEAGPAEVAAAEVGDTFVTKAFQSAGGIIETDSAIAPPRRLLLSLRQKDYGLVESTSAIAPPRHLIVMFEKEFQNRADQLISYAWTKPEEYWTESAIIDPDSGAGHLAWVEQSHGYARLYTATSADAGATVSQQVLIAQSVTEIFNPILAFDSQETLYVVWRSGRYNNANVFFARSIDGGQSWSPAIRINDQSRQAFNPSLSVGSQGHLYVAWQGRHNANVDIYMTSSPDGGQTWNKRIRMAN
jgi:hypothetical protein